VVDSNLIRLRVSAHFYSSLQSVQVMPEVEVSEQLYRQLRTAGGREDIDETLWRLVDDARQRGE